MYYVYELIDPRVNLPFYVGKGKDKRVYFHLSEKSRAKSDNFKKFDKIKKIRKEGYEPEVKIVEYFENENINNQSNIYFLNKNELSNMLIKDEDNYYKSFYELVKFKMVYC